MSIIMFNLEQAATTYDALCARQFPDQATDDIATSVVAKLFDENIDDVLGDWEHTDQCDLKSTLDEYIKDAEGDNALIQIHELLYVIHQDYGHLGTIIRVALVDGLGNLLIQIEEIDNASHNFKFDWKDRILHYPRYVDPRN